MSESENKLTQPGWNRLPMAVETLDRQMEAYPEDTRQAALRLFRLGRERSWSMAKIGTFIGVTAGTISKLFAGKYTAGDFAPITQKIRAAIEEEAQAIDRKRGKVFIETGTTRKLWALFEITRQDCGISMVFANSQIGKTFNAEWFLRKHPEANALFLTLPASAPKRATVESLARALGYSPRGNLNNLIGRCFEGIKNGGIDLLIVDEYSQVFNAHKQTVAQPTVQFIRELWDRCQIGVVLMTTDIELEFRPVLKETLRRCTAELALPNVPPAADLRQIAQAYGYPAPDQAHMKVINSIIAESGMLKFTKALNRGVNLASGKKPAWKNFTDAHEAVAQLARRITR